MKFIKMLIAFLIFYFGFIFAANMLSFAKTISMGNQWIEYGFYVFMVLLLIRYLIYPLMTYMAKPSTNDYLKMFEGDERKTKKIRRYYERHCEPEKVEEIKAIEDHKAFVNYVKSHLESEVKGFSKVIKSFAFKLSSAVLLSPNSFLDGITILYGNANMIYTLSKKVHLRYNGKELFEMYFSVMSVASISGLIEEFDDVMIEVFEELLEELSERLGEEAGSAISDAIPIINIATKATSFLLQSAGNFAYIVYNGNKFKKMVENLYIEEKLSKQEINKAARKEARQSKLTYVKDLSKGIGGKMNPKSGLKGFGFKKRKTEQES